MKNHLVLACVAAGSVGLLPACGRQPAPAGPASPALPAGSSPSASPAPSTPPADAADASPVPAGAPSTLSAPPPGTPSPDQQRQIAALAGQLRARFEACQREAAQAHVQAMAKWQAQQASFTQACKDAEAAQREYQKKFEDPGLDEEDREELAKNPPPPAPLNASQSPPTPFNGEPQANQSFDALIYKFRQAVSARDHAKAAAVMAQMMELAPKTSPSLMATYQEDAKVYLQSFPPSPAP